MVSPAAHFGLHPVMPSPIVYGVCHKRGGRWGGRLLRNGRAIVAQWGRFCSGARGNNRVNFRVNPRGSCE